MKNQYKHFNPKEHQVDVKLAKVRTSNHCKHNINYHLVWIPKYRRKVLINGVDNHLKNIVKEVCHESLADLLEIEVIADHVHIMVEVDPQFGIHKLIKRIKGRSSRILRKEYKFLRSRLPTLWSNSYFVTTLGGAPLEIIKQYIKDQKNV